MSKNLLLYGSHLGQQPQRPPVSLNTPLQVLASTLLHVIAGEKQKLVSKQGCVAFSEYEKPS